MRESAANPFEEIPSRRACEWTDSVERAFDVLARAHDQFIDVMPASAWERDLWGFLRTRLHVGAPGRILQLGCGGGAWTLHLARSGRMVDCVDLSSDMLRAARLRIENAGLSHHVRLVHCDAHDLAFAPDAAYPLVLSLGDTLNYSPEPVVMLREMTRVCEAGGVVIVDVVHTAGLIERLRRAGQEDEAARLEQTGLWAERSASDLSRAEDGGRACYEPLEMRPFSREDLLALAAQACLKPECLFDDTSLAPRLGEGRQALEDSRLGPACSIKLLLVARK